MLMMSGPPRRVVEVTPRRVRVRVAAVAALARRAPTPCTRRAAVLAVLPLLDPF
jgi:hypothetical protein